MLTINAERAEVRPRVRGKFLFSGNKKLYVSGVTYGTFRPDENGEEYDLNRVERDFAQIAANGFNAVRTYTVPPRTVLDSAQRNGLHLLIGLPWEQHVTFLEDKERSRSIEERVRAGVRACSGHPAVLGYTIGNEIPAPIVRWHGRRRIERFLERLYRIAKYEDPHGLVTYVNYPTTEYLELPFVDFVCFNVYLESKEGLSAYLARLQTMAGDRPLIMAEIGFDSRRNGEDAQAHVLEWQIQTTFEAGCAGAFVFSWTDEWHRGGYDIEDWDFGLTTRDRRPKPALTSVCNAFSSLPFAQDVHWPRISVVVCTYNGERTIRDCLEGLACLEYSNHEVIVVNDGSTDNTAAIVQEYSFRLINTENRGLSSARNTGMEAATGEIIAYTDDDARPDAHWLAYLAATFVNKKYAAVGGPNIAPPEDGLIADCINNAPGGPVHILLSDSEAEHVPGCNLAVRRAELREIGGFDPIYRVAGDDVDVCWRLRERGWKLGFSPAAMVWHHRRNSIRAYWKQQVGYGKAEALLEKKWPEKYNSIGHLTWNGRLYGKGFATPLNVLRARIFHGVWGSAPFQSVYQHAPGAISSLALMPEWFLIITVLAAFSALGALWSPLLIALPLLVLAIVILLLQVGLSAARACRTKASERQLLSLKLRCLTTLLHLLQPLARLRGRMLSGLVLWRQHNGCGFTFPVPRVFRLWSELWRSPNEWLRSVQAAAKKTGAVVLSAGDYDCWDLEVRIGVHGGGRVLMAIEEHGSGRQMLRFRCWPKCSTQGLALVLLCSLISTGAFVADVPTVGIIFAVVSLFLSFRTLRECGEAMATFGRVLGELSLEKLYLYSSAEKQVTHEAEEGRAGPGETEPAFVEVQTIKVGS